MSPSDFVIVARTHAYSFSSFSRLMVFYFELVELSMNLGNIVDKVDKERTSWLKIGLGGGESP